MQQLTFVLYQMDEAVRYIKGGRLEQLRLALLLLDNTAELQVERRVRQELNSEDLREGIRTRLLAIPAEHRGNGREFVDWTPLSASEKRRIARYFDAKLTYLADRHKILDSRLAKVLSYLHRYRNEAYHEGRVRRETIRTAALILFEANCLLLLDVFKVVVYSSSDDYSWIGSRFGVKPQSAMFGPGLATIVDDLRSQAVPTTALVAETLTAHLESRIGDLWDALDFIADNSPVEDRAQALKLAQFDPAEPFDLRNWERMLEKFNAPWSVVDVQRLESEIASVKSAADRMEAFALFSDLEERLESIEEPVDAMASAIDQGIQMQIDIQRGK